MNFENLPPEGREWVKARCASSIALVRTVVLNENKPGGMPVGFALVCLATTGDFRGDVLRLLKEHGYLTETADGLLRSTELGRTMAGEAAKTVAEAKANLAAEADEHGVGEGDDAPPPALARLLGRGGRAPGRG